MALDTASADRLGLPANLEAEQALIGIVLLENDALAKLEGINADSFYEPVHSRIWAAIVERVQNRSLADPVTIGGKLATDKGLADLGGAQYLIDLIDHAPPTNRATDYAGAVADAHQRRRLIAISREMIEAAKAVGEADAFSIVAEAERAVRDLARASEPGDANLVDARFAADETLAEIEREAADGRPKGIMTGLRCIDYRLRGLRPGHLVVIAGRPSMGKTALARQAAYGAAARNPGKTVAFFCLEMARREISERALSELTFRNAQRLRDVEPIPYQDMAADKLRPADYHHLRDVAGRIPRNLVLDDTASLSVEYVRRRVWALKRRGPLAAVFIDYLQIMKRPDTRGRNDAAIIGEMTSELKRIAREADCAIVLLSQVSRALESRDDKRPQLSDLRESGSIEQDANSVLFPFREAYYLERAEPKPGTVERDAWEAKLAECRRGLEVICAKNRGGAIGTDRQEYFPEFDAITDQPKEQGQ